MNGVDFMAVDVETANENYWSICQVGIAVFQDGQLSESWGTLVNPETYFLEINMEIHGIEPEHVKDAPKLNEMYETVIQRLGTNIVAHHMPFDRLAFSRCSEKTQKPLPSCRWIDTARVARRTWESVRKRGYGLANLADLFSISFKHHDAIEDARVAGLILVKASESVNQPFNEWITEFDCGKPKPPSTNEIELIKIAGAEPDCSGPLFGEVVVFTGTLSISRIQAAQVAYQMGCNIDLKVTKSTTLLVVGEQDPIKLRGQEKSSKQKMAEQLIAAGQPIRILGETDFLSMINY